jgi:AcrR family transcriptional regulator
MARANLNEAAAARPATRLLTLEEIVDAAAGLVAAEGFEALSMRRLAGSLGVGAMTLYGYVRTKEELLGELANRFLAGVELPSEGLPWQEQVARVLRSVRRVFLEHPELIPIVANQRIDGRAAYRGAEVMFDALQRAGLDDQTTISAFDALVSLTIGSAERETGLRNERQSLPGIRELEPGRYPHTIRLAGLLATRDPEHDFEVGVELLIRGIEGSVA